MRKRTSSVRECPYLPPFYIDYLRGYQFNPSEVKDSLDEERHLHISAEGLLYRVDIVGDTNIGNCLGALLQSDE